MMTTLYLVVPCYNEEEALPETARRLLDKLSALQRSGAPDWNRAQQLAKRIIAIPHGLSMHCGGVVISPGDLSRSAPTAKPRPRGLFKRCSKTRA